jgi:tripartite-type tricarboxylate transporter receptor subunit TctC
MFNCFKNLLLVSVLLAGAHAYAQNYPTKPINLVVTYPPGGTVDAVARIIAPKLSAQLGQPIVVDNRGGAGGMIGGNIVAKSAPDGYTLMLDASNHAQNPALRSRMQFDTLKDFAPISLLVKVPNLIVVYPPYQVKSVKDLISLAKAKPATINYASAGNGSSPHLAAELFDMMAGTEMVHVPYKGGGPAMVDVISGQVPLFFSSMASAMSYVKSGKMRPVAIAAKERSAALPEVPTVAEAGLPGYEMYEWNAMFAPAGTPKSIIDRLSKEIAIVLKDPDVKGRLAGIGAEVVGSTPEELDRFRRAELEKWINLGKKRKIQID